MRNIFLACMLMAGVLVACDSDPKNPASELQRDWKFLYRIGGIDQNDTVFAVHDTIAINTFQYTDELVLPKLNQYRLVERKIYKDTDIPTAVTNYNYDIILVESVFDGTKMWSVRTQDFTLSNNGRLIMFDASGNLILRDNAVNAYTHYYTKSF